MLKVSQWPLYRMACDADMTVAMAAPASIGLVGKITMLSREPAATETRFFVLTRNLSINCRRGAEPNAPANAMVPAATERLLGMISTAKATMHKIVGASADDLLPPRDLAKAAFAVMVWASSKMSAEERDKQMDSV